MSAKAILLTAFVLLSLVSCEKKKTYYRPAYNTDTPAVSVGSDDGADDVGSDDIEAMEPCPFCGGSGGAGNGLACGFCGGRGEVSAAAAAQGRHVMNGGSVSDFYPSGSSSSGSSQQSGPRDRMCPSCDGSGVCPVCRGNGEVTYYGNTSVCDFCYGGGRCPKCTGHGTIPDLP